MILLSIKSFAVLARSAVKKMLDRHAPEVNDRVVASTIPFSAG
jgi:hypothetical protein